MKKVWGPYIALAILLIVCAISSEHFRNINNLSNIARQVSYSGIIAMGMTLVIAAGGIDLSVGSLLALSGVISLTVMNMVAPHCSEFAQLGVAIIVALSCGVLGGAINGALVAWCKIPPFIVTLGTFSIFRSLGVFEANAGLVLADNGLLNCTATGWIPAIVLAMVAIILSVVVNRTPFGRHLCAVGSNEKVARYAAIATGRVKLYTYMIVGLLSGVSAYLLAGRLNSISSTGAGSSYELDAIAAVIIGGTPMTGGRGYIGGTLAGVFILGIISNVLDLWSVSSNLQGTVKGLVIIIAVLFQYKKGMEK